MKKIINPKVMKKIENDLGLSKRTVYRRIAEKEKDTKILDKNLAALVFALENDVDIYSTLSDEEKIKLRVYSGNNPQVIVNQPIKHLTKKDRKETIKIDLSFIKDADLKRILERDIKELNAIYDLGIDETAKTCIILSGSIMEALVLAALKEKQSEVSNYSVKIGKSFKIDESTFNDLIKIASNITLPLLAPDIIPSVNQIRNWRNLIHPGREVSKAKKNRISPTAGRARTAIGLLHLISEEINKNI